MRLKRLCSANHVNASAVRATGNSEPKFNNCQPWVVTRAPEANEVSAITAKTQKLIAACARSFSSGR